MTLLDRDHSAQHQIDGIGLNLLEPYRDPQRNITLKNLIQVMRTGPVQLKTGLGLVRQIKRWKECLGDMTDGVSAIRLWETLETRSTPFLYNPLLTKQCMSHLCLPQAHAPAHAYNFDFMIHRS